MTDGGARDLNNGGTYSPETCPWMQWIEKGRNNQWINKLIKAIRRTIWSCVSCSARRQCCLTWTSQKDHGSGNLEILEERARENKMRSDSTAIIWSSPSSDYVPSSPDALARDGRCPLCPRSPSCPYWLYTARFSATRASSQHHINKTTHNRNEESRRVSATTTDEKTDHRW